MRGRGRSMNINNDCLSMYGMVGIGMNGGLSAGSYATCCGCATGNCTSRAAQATLEIAAVSTEPVFPSNLSIVQAPQGVYVNSVMRPGPVVALVGLLTPGALYG
jgi:hypothetical protein